MLILVSISTGCGLISAFASLAGILAGSPNSVEELKICVITAGVKKYKWMMWKKEKNLVKTKKIPWKSHF